MNEEQGLFILFSNGASGIIPLLEAVVDEGVALGKSLALEPIFPQFNYLLDLFYLFGGCTSLTDDEHERFHAAHRHAEELLAMFHGIIYS